MKGGRSESAFGCKSSLTRQKAIVTASNGTVIKQRPPGQAHRSQSQECITDITIVKKGRCAMEPGGNKRKRSVTRRDFLRTSGVAAGSAGLAPLVSAPFVADALAQTKTLRILQWS